MSRLDIKAAEVIQKMVGEFPLAPGFGRHSEDWDELGGTWGGATFDSEWITHQIVADETELAALLGFPSEPEIEKRLSPEDRADLWCPEGVVGEVKNVVTSHWGPDQIERYIATCDARWPKHRWKGVLVQGEDYLTPSARRRLEQSKYYDRISLWCVYEDPDDDDVVVYDQLWPEP